MDCPSLADLLANEPAEGQIRTETAIDDHLQGCESCRGRLAEHRETIELLSEVLPMLDSAGSVDCPDPGQLEVLVERAESLPAAVRASLEAHAQACRACRSYCSELRAWNSEPEPAQPPTFKVLHRAAQPGGTRPDSGRLPSWRLVAMPAMVAVAVLVITVGVLDLKKNQRDRTIEMEKQAEAPAVTRKPPAEPRQKPTPIPRTRTSEAVSVPVEPEAPPSEPPVPAVQPVESKSRAKPPAITRGLEAAPTMLQIPGSAQPVTLASGDRYGLRIPPRAAPAWIYVFQSDETGSAAALFPNASFGARKNPVDAHQGLTLPDEGRWYQLDEVVGKEMIYVVVADEPQALCESLVRSAGPEGLRALQQSFSRSGGLTGAKLYSQQLLHVKARGH